jgi:hypothetical protein
MPPFLRAMIDLNDKEKRGRLFKAIKTSREAMEPFRRVRKELIRDYVGSWYSESGARNKTLVNLMNQTARIYTIALAANNPQVLVSTPRELNLPFARRFEANLNHLISDMNLDQTFRDIVLDAFFCIGCAVVMMRDTDTRFHGIIEAEEDVWLDPGEPWLNRVPLDDLILDMSVRERTKMRYCGHRYRADFEKVMDEPGYSKKVKAKLTATNRLSKETEGSARDIQTGEGEVEDDELKDMIWLQDVWIAENNSIATFACDYDEPPLIERDWIGSQAGPYKFLSLGDVPDNIIPASPAINLKGMHDLQNRLHRRMEKDSDAHRVINVYPPEESDFAERARTAGRNDWIKGRSPEQIKQFETGGIDQRDLALATFIQDEYDRFAGNLQAMGGLGPQAATVGQEELIHGAVSRNEADMRLAVVNFASDCILDLGRLMWEDQQLEIQTSIPVGSSGIQVSADWNPNIRSGEFEDYEFRVEPYSMVFKTPEQKLQEMFQTLQQLAPLWPMFQASGATLDAEAIVDEIARLKNRPEFKRFITFASPADMLGGDENTVRQSPVTSRETVRRNVPTGGTKDARSSALIQSAMGGGSQVNGQMASAMGRAPA